MNAGNHAAEYSGATLLESVGFDTYDRFRENSYDDIMECTDAVTREYWMERCNDTKSDILE